MTERFPIYHIIVLSLYYFAYDNTMTRLRTKSERDIILQSIFEVYPTKLIELDFETPFQLLTAVMLSAQMTDK